MQTTDQCVDEMVAAAGSGLDIEPVASPATRPARSHLLAGLPPEELEDVLAAFDTQRFNAGHRITLEGFRGREFYLIAEGRAVVTIAGRRVAELGPGDFFGEVAVLRDGLRSATVTAETQLRCLVLSDDALERLLVAHPQLGVNMLREVLSRFVDVSPQPERPRVLAG
jgi:CRP-like cAMP-binding protein